MFLIEKLKGADAAVNLFFVCLCIVLIYIPTGFEHLKPEGSNYAKAEVTAVDNSDIKTHLILKTGTQELEVRLLNGAHKNEVIRVFNTLKGKMELDEIYAKGQKILVEYSVADGKIKTAYSRGVYRIQHELWLIAFFALLLIAIGGWTGIKALLSFFLSALMLWKVMVPLFLKGYDPILVALVVVGFLTIAISVMIGGMTKRGLVTFTGAFLGVVLTCILAVTFNQSFFVHGAVRPFAETLLYSGFVHLDITRIFLAGIFIASSGAVMDLAMDISASMQEVKTNNPDISIKSHISSGMTVGRAVIGTMTTTLLLAYSGGYMMMMMLFMSQGVPLVNFFNINFVAAEVLNTLVGSFGLVTVAPLTALAGGVIYAIKPSVKKEQSTQHSIDIVK